MKEYLAPQIIIKDFRTSDVIAVSNEILDEHRQGSKAILSHEWKDTWN